MNVTNKGVISRIVEDDEMPILETGERVDIIFNTLGVINRVNSFQLIEQSITFILNRTCERLTTMYSLDDKQELLLDIVSTFSPREGDQLAEYLKTTDREQFFRRIEESKMIHINIPPLWEGEVKLFDKIRGIYKKYDWIKPYDVYIKKFGRRRKIMKPMIVGDMYVLKLKQTSKKGFSARSTGSISMKGIPEKSNKAKVHQDLYPRTPIKMGDQEGFNLSISADTKAVAKLHKLYRTSVTGRKILGEMLITESDGIFDVDVDLPNRNMEILRAYFKSMGYKIDKKSEKLYVEAYDDTISTYEVGDKLVISDKEYVDNEVIKQRIKEDFLSNLITDKESYKKLLDDKFNEIKKNR